MPTWQGMEFLDRVLSALAGQELDLPWDFRAIDSGSQDGTWELLGDWSLRFPVPFARERIQQIEFDHGDTRNLLAARSAGELLVFLTQDAIPSSPRWLATLVANFDDPKVGGAYCRNVPRPDARPLTRIFSAEDPGYALERRVTRLPDARAYAALNPDERRALYTFQDVASAVRRELWERHPFPRADFGEDVLMARALLEAGFATVYDTEATVEHSHDYDAAETYRRAFVDGRFNAEWLDRLCVVSDKDIDVLLRRTGARDAAAIAALGYPEAQQRALVEEARVLRCASFQGLQAGGQSARRHARTALRADGRLKVLYVLHGFPPDTWAGTEIYTYNLAHELQRRGHEVVLLARTPARDASEEDFSVREDEFQGLRVLRMVHRLEHGTMRMSYEQPKADAVLRRVLLAERPDLVHFQHLIHTSIGLVQVAQDFGLPTAITCHDYWALCARVQLIRPDGSICPSNMGSGCYLCVKEQGLEHVPRAARFDAAVDGLLPDLARAARGTTALGALMRARATEYLDVRAREELVPAAYAACDLRISPSRFLRDKYLESGHFDPHTFLFSDNGMRTDHVQALEKRPDPEGRVRFGFVGTLVWYKGGATLLEAMRLLAGERCVLRVHGGFEPERDAHHAQLAALAAEAGNVRFEGRFDNARLSDVYAQIDVLIVPSVWYENSPITIHEAFLTRTPVVASDLGGMAEFVREGVDGLLFRVGDAAHLAQVLRRFVREPGLVGELSRDFPHVKTIEENAEETEFRYRALCCRDRSAEAGPQTLLEVPAIGAARREGPVEQQGAEMLLLRPGGAAVEYELGSLMPGPVQVVVDVLALGCEPDTEHGGRVLVDGLEVGRLELFRARGEDELRSNVFDVELPEDVRRLRVESAIAPGGPEATLRLTRVSVRTRPRVGGLA
jgi:glycosyltransferase involved in cell wall biosynthesis